MKLRLRSLETKQTHKIEVPNTCNLQQLKQAVILQIFPSSSSSTVEHNLLLSLNRKEELFGSSNEDSLQSLGVTSGDLIYYTLNPNAFSLQTPGLSHVQLDNNAGINSSNDHVVNLMNTHVVESGKFDELNNPNVEIRDIMEEGSKLGNPSNDTGNLGEPQLLESSKDGNSIDSGAQGKELMDTQIVGSSELRDNDKGKSIELVEGNDEMEIDDESENKGIYKYSVPSFLKKVLVKEVGDSAANGGDHKLLVIAVHAVLLESGFVGYDPVLRRIVDGFYLAEEWPSLAFDLTLHYTLPDVKPSKVVKPVVLKFQSLGKYMNIYGSLPKKGYRVHRVCLDELRFLPVLTFIWKSSDEASSENLINGSRKLYPNQGIFEFWKTVKDGLSYPLLIDLCEHVGIVPPPCLMRLPTELKLKILESLPAMDVARAECVCSELRFVASNNDLWKLKYEEEFGIAVASQRECQWKAKFSFAWEIRKKRKMLCVPFLWKEPPHFRPLFPGRRDPNFFGSPFAIGGDYDRLPGFGSPQSPGSRFFRRNCFLGGNGQI